MTAAGCPDPARCPVPSPASVELRRIRIVWVVAGRPFFTSYRRKHWPALFNRSGLGSARFSPLNAAGNVVPTLYLARTQTVALLESSFHEVHQLTSRMISESVDLAPRGLVAVSAPDRLPLIDLTNESLDRLGLRRDQIVSTTAEHYVCTQDWAAALHGRKVSSVTPVGILWQSRVAELASGDSLLLNDLLRFGDEVALIFGDRVATDAARWNPGAPHYDDLSQGDGRLLVEAIAEQLDATIIPA